MPIYEFYCPDCHRLFNFFSARVDRDSRPPCPRCGRPELPRKPSSFATLKHRGEGGGESDDPLAALDDERLEGAMGSLMQEMSGLENEEDPRAMGRLVRRFGELAGLEMGEQMEDYVERLEAGEDLDRLDQELEESLGGDAPLEELFKLKQPAVAERRRQPSRDDKLYFL